MTDRETARERDLVNRRAANRRWYAKNRDRQLAYYKRWRVKNAARQSMGI
ncbi:hypothetical protein [Sphingomonas paeninsulae]|nr:hypothetical protein [Sphingomonas paeninsulae]